jgi:hypothetical protein
MDEDNPTSNTRTLKEISAYVVVFARFKCEESIRQVMGWKRYANYIKKTCLAKKSYFLRMTSTAGKDEDLNPHKSLIICWNAMMAILGKGYRFWKTCCKAADANNVPMYGLKGKLDDYLSLCWFFDEMEELAKPRATRLVHELTNNGLQDDNNTLDLPAWTTKETSIVDGVLSRGGTFGQQTWEVEEDIQAGLSK